MLVISPASAETRALIAGIWEFKNPNFPPLVGPKNDVAAISKIMTGDGIHSTDVTVLTNEQMTRTAFETALHAMALRAKPGDWLFVYYSGHGSTADAAVKGTADGDLDEFLPLGDFNPANPESYIVDKDLYTWVSRYVPPNVQIFMVIDSCHSGTMHRSVDLAKAQFRRRSVDFRGEYGDFKLTARPGPSFPSALPGASDAAPAGNLSRPELTNEIYIGGAQDDQSALEQPMPVPSAPSRGFLTYALEHGLTDTSPDGKRMADLDGDGQITVEELFKYVKSQVGTYSDHLQEPSGKYTSEGAKTVLFQAHVPPPVKPLEPGLPQLYTVGGNAGVTGSGFGLAASAAAADFVWDRAAGTVTSKMGDVVAEGVLGNAALTGVIEKWAAVNALRPVVIDKAATLTINPAGAGARYFKGDHVTIGLDVEPSGGDRYVTVFNLASDGKVQRLYPLGDEEGGRVAAGARLPIITTRVIEPYGADHVLAVITPSVPSDLRDLLRTIDGQRAAGRLPAVIRRTLAQGGAAASLSLAPLYTADRTAAAGQ